MGASRTVGGEGRDTSVIQIGDITVTPFVSSRFRLDGGSMFGVVPRTLWERKAPPDSRNRIEMNSNSLLIETAGLRLLVEPGMGTKYDSSQSDIYALADMSASTEVAHLGTAPDDVDLVVLTHLHLDHAGGATACRDSGEVVPAFPNAGVVVQRRELEEAERRHPLVAGSYRPDDYQALLRRNKLFVVEGDAEVAPGVRVELTGGHSPGHQVIRMVSGDDEGLFLGDIVPTTAHLKLNWLMAWDLEPRVVYEQKARLLADCAHRDVLIFWSHDPLIAACRITEAAPGSYAVEEESVVKAGGDAG
jgi:glyoxylase-like metal-dependent hydrolase (beta-lactamase superfamily II)